MTHTALAVAFHSKLIAIDEDEAKLLADKSAAVLAHYGEIPGLNQKTLDWLGLLYALGLVYGPRVMAARATAEAKPKPPEAPKPSETRPAGGGSHLPPNAVFGAPSAEEMVQNVKGIPN